MDIDKLQQCVRANVGDLTFLEAYQLSHRAFNVSIASATQSEPRRLLNHLTAPDVLLWSAACASCALPGLYAPVALMAKRHGRIEPYHPADLEWADGQCRQTAQRRQQARTCREH